MYKDRDGTLRQRLLSCGVPQDCILRPLLVNMGYDWALRGRLSPGLCVIGYADNMLVTIRGGDPGTLQDPPTTGFIEAQIRRRLFVSVVRFTLLALGNFCLCRRSQRQDANTQGLSGQSHCRTLTTQDICSYCTVSTEVACTLALAPLDVGRRNYTPNFIGGRLRSGRFEKNYIHL